VKCSEAGVAADGPSSNAPSMGGAQLQLQKQKSGLNGARAAIVRTNWHCFAVDRWQMRGFVLGTTETQRQLIAAHMRRWVPGRYGSLCVVSRAIWPSFWDGLMGLKAGSKKSQDAGGEFAGCRENRLRNMTKVLI